MKERRAAKSRLLVAVAALVFGGMPAAALAQPGSSPDPVPAFEQEPMPREDAPNVVYILLDDTGFADLGAYGSEIRTPNMDQLAGEGLRFNNFHTRAICSPTRAALLTGRNSHTVGVANVTNMLSGYAHGQGRISNSAATVAELLKATGYRTFALGKWHLTPLSITSSREQWPLARGFDRFYGFLDGMTDQFYPDMVVDNSPIDLVPKPGYHLSVDLVDKAVSYVAAQKASDPKRPFFLYLAFGATHAPHHVPDSYVRKYDALYRQGWDKIREQRFARQKALGIIPRNAELAPRNPDVKAWAELSPQQQDVYARFQAAYAGFLEHTDEQIGRLVDFLRRSGQLDNTMIVLTSDNGGSVEGHQTGTLNEVRSLNLIPEPIEEMVPRKDEIGTERTYPNYPSGWAQVSNTPFRFYKTSVWDGGTRDPLIVYAPNRIKDPGNIRGQFIDVIDITPTVLDIVGITPPASLKGVAQMPIAGASFRQVLADAKAPAPRDTQYFELLGQRAIWHKGWKAISEHKLGEDFDKDVWHLYDTRKDFSVVRDLSASNPQKLQELQSLWWSEARKYGVLPLVNAPLYGSFSTDKGGGSVVKYKTRRDPRPEYVFYPEQERGLRAEAPMIGTGSFAIDVELGPRDGTESGVLVADGDRFGGYTLFVKDSQVTFEQSDLGDRSSLTAGRPLSAKVRRVRFVFDRTDAKGGRGTFYFDGAAVGSGHIARRETNLTSVAGFSVGYDTGGPVSDSYADKAGFAFPRGKMERIVFRRTDDAYSK